MPRLGGALDVVQVSDPASPVAGRQFLYFKSDGNLYMKNSAGTITQVNGGAAPANMVTTDTVQTITAVKTLSTAGGTVSLIALSSDQPATNTVLSSPTFQLKAKRDVAGAVSTYTMSLYGTVDADGTNSRLITSSPIQAQVFQALGVTGANSGTRYVGSTTTGSPTTGTFAVGDFVVAQNGKVWVCTTAGTPGVWVISRENNLYNGPGAPPAGITFVAQNNTITYVCSVPATAAVGDLLVMTHMSDATSIAPPAGWTQQAYGQGSGSGSYPATTYIWSKVCVLADIGASQTLSPGSGNNFRQTYIAAYRGVDGVTPVIVGSAVAGVGTTATQTALNVGNGGYVTVVLSQVDIGGNATAATTPSGYTSRAIVTPGSQSHLQVWDTVAPQSGLIPAQAFTWAASHNYALLWMGVAASTAATGVQNGDFYFDTTNKALYGPRTTGSWGSPSLLTATDLDQTITGIKTHTKQIVAQYLSASGLTGATAASRYVGATTTGAPTGANPFLIGDYVIAQNGRIWVCTVAGSPGTWVDVAAGGSAGATLNVVTKASAYTSVDKDVVLASGTTNITLPTATINSRVNVKNVGTGVITVIPQAGPLSDSYTRADSTTTPGVMTTGQSYTIVQGTWGILNNQLYSASKVDNDRILYNTGGPNQTNVANVGTLITNGYFGILARCSLDGLNFYKAQVDPAGQVSLAKVISGGADTVLGTSSVGAAVTGSQITISAQGTALTVKVGATTVISVTDASITTGNYGGFRHGQTAAVTLQFDNLSAATTGTLDGATSYSLNLANSAGTFVSDGTSWFLDDTAYVGSVLTTGYTFASALSTYPDLVAHSGIATVANGWPVQGFITGYRNGTTGTQRLQADGSAATWARYWNAAGGAWTAFALYVDSADFIAKGSMEIGTGAGTYSDLAVGANGTVHVADSTAATGTKWGDPTSESLKAGGATGNGTTDDRAAFVTLDTNLAANYGIVVGAGRYRIGSNLTITRTLDFRSGGRIVVSTGVTVTINAAVEAGIEQIFELEGTASVVLSVQYNYTRYPEWWGGVVGADCSPAFAQCIVSGSLTILQARDYVTSATMMVPAYATVQGAGCYWEGANEATRILAASPSITIVQLGSTATPVDLNSAPAGATVYDIYFTRNQAPNAGTISVLIGWSRFARVERCRANTSITIFKITNAISPFITDTFAKRDIAIAAGQGTDSFIGYDIDGTGALPAAGGNASVWMTRNQTELDGNVTIANSTGFYLHGRITDTFITQPETVGCSYGMDILGDKAGTPAVGSNENVVIQQPVIDQSKTIAIRVQSINKWGGVQILQPYCGPSTGDAITVSGCDGFVGVYGGQMRMSTTTTGKGVTFDTCREVALLGTHIAECTTQAVVLNVLSGGSIEPIIQNVTATLSAAVQSVGTVTKTVIKPQINGDPSKVSMAYQSLATTNANNVVYVSSIATGVVVTPTSYAAGAEVGTTYPDAIVGSSAPISITAVTTAVAGATYLASGTFAITIPIASNTRVIIKNTGAGIITATPASGSIDSAASFAIPALGSIDTVSDGTNVWII